MNKSNQNYDTLSPGSSISIPTYSSGSSTSCLSGNSSLSSSPQQDNLVMPSQPIYILNQPMSNSSSSPSDSLSSLIMKQNAEDMQMSQAYSQSCMNPSEDYLDSSLSDDLDSNQTSSNLNMSSNLNSGRANRFFPDSVVDILNKWFNENQEYPYPDDNMTNILAKEANISAKQVRKWFANKRVRSNKCFKQTCRTKKERRQTKSISDADMFNMHPYNKLSSDNEEESDDMVGHVNFTLTNLNFKKNKMSKRGQITKCKSTNFNSSSPMPQYQYNTMEQNQLISNELSDQVNDNLDQHQQFYSDFGGHHHQHQQQQQHKSNLQRSASVQSAQELINLYNLSLWKNALLENSNNNNKTSLDNGHYGSMHCSQSFANQQSLAQQQQQQLQQQQQMQTTSSVTSAVVAAAALYNPYLLMNLFQNPIAFQAALTNRLLNLDNKTSSASPQQQQQGNSFNESNGNNMEMSPNSAQHCYTGQTSGCGKMKTNRSSKTCLHKRRNSSLIKLQQEIQYEENNNNNNNNSSMLEDASSKLNERVYNLSKGSSLSSSPSSSSTYDALNDSRRSSIASISTASAYFNDSNNNNTSNHLFSDLNKQKLMQHLNEQNQFKQQQQAQQQQQQTIRKTKINFGDISDLIN